MLVSIRTFVCRLTMVVLATALAFNPIYLYAGTTGSLTGSVTDATGNAVADATVSVTSPSQSATVHTDAGGRFTFISLAPDTYAISIDKVGFNPISTGGISIFADQSQTLVFALQPALKDIARVSSRTSSNLVKSGTTTDVYSVNSTVTAAAAPIGGGGSLNTAYSAIAAMPGAYVPNGQMGVNQTVYIRGGYYDQIGYEYDGVPVNRSFDNYPGHSASTLGQQELQIYTGGGGAGSSATGLAGFINQVVKTGTYPGSGSFESRIGSPTFYHDVSLETGGANPARTFSYYLGVSGYNQDFRYFDQANGGDLMALFPYAEGPSNKTTNLTFYPAVYPTCATNLDSPFDNGTIAPPNYYSDPGCFSAINPAYSSISLIRGRELIGNVHFAVPHKRDAGRDDIQLLYNNSVQYRQYYSGVNDAGYSTIYNPTVGGANWPDYYTYGSGTAFLAPADATPIAYLFPGSPTNRCANVRSFVANACPSGSPSALPNDYRDARWDSASIIKLQYQKNIGDSAYLRLFGYSFYSNTNRSGASRRGLGSGFGATNYDYEVDAHTRGLELQFADQLNDKNQITGTLNYTTAKTVRVNNYNYLNSRSYAVSNLTNGAGCFASTSGTGDNGIDNYNYGDPAPCNDSISQGTFQHPTAGTSLTPCTTDPGDFGGSAACAANATFKLTYTGNQASTNHVTPKFASFALQDEWRPNDKFDVNLGLRIERDEYDLDTADTAGKSFWFAAAQKEYCYNPVTLAPVIVPQPPQNESTTIPYVSFTCPVDSSSGTPIQTVHPDGQSGHLLLSNIYNPVMTQSFVQPRLGITYTANPDTVLRFSAGRYVQQPQAYEVEYNSQEENLANQLINFLPYGYTTPRHDVQAQYSNNFDLSYERHFKGTDMSLKLTPYYRYATNQLYDADVTLNTGIETSYGLEFQFAKGDFNKNGLAAILSYTYLHAKERYVDYAGTNRNPIDGFNDYIAQYNALTQSGGGAPCYANSADATADPTCAAGSIRNPYYTSTQQPLYDRNAGYEPGLSSPYLSPNVFALIVNYKHDKFTITPAATLAQGTTYGSPQDVIGIDPRTCAQDGGDSGFGGDPLRADYTSCSSAATPTGKLYVPNPETGSFDGFGAFRQPWQLNLGVQMSYAVSEKIKANLTVANLYNRCFGGSSTAWTSAYRPSSTVCGYAANSFYVNNFANGTGPNDLAANGVPLNPYFAHSFVPSYGDTNSYNFVLPVNLYFQLQIKL